jgi:transcriptional regulator with XRE-family HTH domain
MDQTDLRQIVGANIRRLRESKAMSQRDLACKAGVNRTYLSRLERGVNYARIDTIGKLARVLGAEPADLLKWPPIEPEPA